MSQKHELVQKLHSMAALIFSHQPVLVQPAPKYISFVLSNDAFKKYFIGFDILPMPKTLVNSQVSQKMD